MKSRYLILFLASCLALFLIIGCDNPATTNNPTQSDENSDTTEKSGTLSLYLSGNSQNLMRKPEEATSAVVTFDRFQVHYTAVDGGEAGWIDLDPPASSIDVLNIGVMQPLVEGEGIPEGAYNVLRFYATNATVTTESGTYEAEVISGKIQINASFNISSDDTTSIELSCSAKVISTGNPDDPSYIVKININVKGVDDPDDDDDEDEEEEEEEEDEEEEEENEEEDEEE